MITKGRAIDEMLRWLDEATINGEQPAPEQLADYRDRAAHLLSGVVSLIAEQFRIPASFTVVQNPVPNLLGDTYRLESVMPGEPFVATVNGLRSFYLEIMGDVAVSVRCGQDIIYSCEEYSENEFLPLCANVDAQGVATITVESEYPASVRYPAAYAVPFPYDELVQPNTPYVAYELPHDLREYEKCVRTSDGTNYEEFQDVRREGFRTFLLPRRAKGQFTFHYWRNPCAVPHDAADDHRLEVAPEAEPLIGLKLAADVTRGIPECQSVSYWLDAEFSSRINNLARQERGGIVRIQPTYSM